MTNKSNPDFIDQFSKGSFLLIHDNESALAPNKESINGKNYINVSTNQQTEQVKIGSYMGNPGEPSAMTFVMVPRSLCGTSTKNILRFFLRMFLITYIFLNLR